jgi:hypothetical protein
VLGLVQVVGLHPDRQVPAAHRDPQLPRAGEQVLADRRVRHQQLGEQLAAGPDRGLDGPPGQVEVPRGGRRRGVQD